MTGPLRRVQGVHSIELPGLDRLYAVHKQLLECGHLLPFPHDIAGPRHPDRRRCWKCGRGLRADVTGDGETGTPPTCREE